MVKSVVSQKPAPKEMVEPTDSRREKEEEEEVPGFICDENSHSSCIDVTEKSKYSRTTLKRALQATTTHLSFC